MIEQLLEYNREFVKSGAYEKFQTSKYPDKKIAILTCMDTRLVEAASGGAGYPQRRCEDDQKRRRHDYRPL